MREPYVDGVAIHDDPESCGGAREGAVEAFDRGTSRLGIEPRNQAFRDADAVIRSGKQHEPHREREVWRGPARSKAPCMFGTSLRENREISRVHTSLATWAASGRP